MQDLSASSDQTALNLIVCWLLIIPLFYFASFGSLWFQTVDHNNSTSEIYGAIATHSPSWGGSLPEKMVFLVVLLVICPKIKSVAALSLKDGVFASITTLALVSASWSQYSTDSLHWSLFLAMNTIFVFFLFRRFSPRQQIELFLMLGTVCLVCSLTLSLFFPRYGVEQGAHIGAWRGMYPQKNMCAMATLYMLPSAFCLPSRSSWFAMFKVVYVSMSVFLIAMSRSQSSLVSLALLAPVLIAIKLTCKFESKERPILFLIGTITALVLVAVAFSNVGRMAYALGRDPSLTGRTQIWKAVMEAIAKQPLLGYGYHSFWRGYQGESANLSLAAHWAVTSSHNGLLEVWLTLGVAGLGLVGYSMVRALRDSFVCLYSGRLPYAQWCTCIALMTIFVSLDEGELTMPNNLTWMLFMLACVGLSEGAKTVRLGLDDKQIQDRAKVHVAPLSCTQSELAGLLL